MFASGAVVRPRKGIEAVVDQLAGGLEKTDVRLGTAVVDTEAQSVGLADGSRIEGSCVISTIGGREAVEWNAAFNAVFACEAVAFGRPIIGLLPDADCVTNVHFMEDVQGAEGQGLLNVTALPPDPSQADPAFMEGIRRDLDQAGLRSATWYGMPPFRRHCPGCPVWRRPCGSRMRQSRTSPAITMRRLHWTRRCGQDVSLPKRG